MQTVFSNSMVAHVWAQQNQENGRNSSSSIFFEGKTIYSYGRHFPMAEFHDDCILINSDRYSVTTGKHQSLVRQAIYGHNKTIFTVPDVSNPINHNKNIKWLKDSIKTLALKVARARSNKSWLLTEMQGTINEGNKYCEYFKLKESFKQLDNSELETILKHEKEERKKQNKHLKELKKQKVKESKLKLKRWMKQPQFYFNANDFPIMLRIKGQEIQTSQNAAIPIEHGLSAWKMVQKCKKEKREFIANGHTIKVGHFQVTKITKDGTLKAGCHTIKYGPMKYIARQLSWI
jgi:hypothetical protein